MRAPAGSSDGDNLLPGFGKILGRAPSPVFPARLASERRKQKARRANRTMSAAIKTQASSIYKRRWRGPGGQYQWEHKSAFCVRGYLWATGVFVVYAG
jgi:hypothetical protein